MKVLSLTLILLVVSSDAQFWNYSQQLFNPFSWIRQGKTADTTNPNSLGKSTSPSFAGATTNANPPSTKTPIPLSLSYPPPSLSAQVSPLLQSPPVIAPLVVLPTTVPITNGSTTEKLPEVLQLKENENKFEAKESSEVDSQQEEKLESKLGVDIDLGPIHPVKVTASPIATTNAKSPRTTLSERGTTGNTAATKRALKTKSTASPLFFYSHSPYVSQSTRHQPSSHQASSHSSHSSQTSPVWTTVPITTHLHKNAEKPSTDRIHSSPHHTHHASSSSGTTAALRPSSTATVTEATTTYFDTTTQEATGTTEESRDNHRQHDFYLSKREKPQVKIATNISQNLLPLPAGASAALVKPTKYHYYPHNQHIYLLPECAIQQVCNAVYVRLNWTQPLCACPSRYRDPCSASLNSDDLHTTELQVDKSSKRALTLVKTCEPTSDMRVCRSPRDWSLLALQNIRTGKSHYLVICRCPDSSTLEGPMSHDQPTYASVPGIRVYGMMCVSPPPSLSSQSNPNKRRGRPLRLSRSIDADPPFPWEEAVELAKTADWKDN